MTNSKGPKSLLIFQSPSNLTCANIESRGEVAPDRPKENDRIQTPQALFLAPFRLQLFIDWSDPQKPGNFSENDGVGR